MRSLKKVLSLVMLAFLCGCTVRMLDFTLISSKNVAMRIPQSSKGERVIGKDMVPVFVFPLGIPNLKEAIDRAIESAGPGYDALIDGVLYNINNSFIIGEMGYRVEGTPIKTSEVKAAMLERGEDPTIVMSHLLMHSASGIPNEGVIQQLGIQQTKNEGIAAE